MPSLRFLSNSDDTKPPFIVVLSGRSEITDSMQHPRPPATATAAAMSNGDTVPLHPTSQSDIDEIENLIYTYPSVVPSARSPSPPRVSGNSLPPPPVNRPYSPPQSVSRPIPVPPVVPTAPSPIPPKPQIPLLRGSASGGNRSIGESGFGSGTNTLSEPVWETIHRDLTRIVSNLQLVVFPNPYREDPGKALRDWDLWGPFFFIVFLGLVLSWSASVEKVWAKYLFAFLRFIYCCDQFSNR